MKSKSTVTSNGRITIPKKIREQTGLHAGMRLDFQILENGIILLIPLKLSIVQLKGIVKTSRKKPVSESEFRQAISRGAQKPMK